MDAYGRPKHLSTRKQSAPPSVVFLNETYKQNSSSVGSGLVAPSSSDSSKDVLRFSNNNQHQAATSAPTAASTMTPSLAQQQQRSHSFRTVPRPQSGGIPRPSVPDTAATQGIFSSSSTSSTVSTSSLSPSVTKQRPNTAKLSSRPPFPMVPQAFMSFGGMGNKSKPREEVEDTVEDIVDMDLEERCPAEPEIDGLEQNQTHQDRLYIQQLKDDILYLTQLLSTSHMDNDSLGAAPTTHVKHLLYLRDEKTLAMQTQLTRYNPSNNPVQTMHTKIKLEEILGESLSKLMDKHLMSVNTGSGESTGTITTDTGSTPKAKGWGGMKTPSVCYTSAFVSMLERSSKLQTKLVAFKMEKKELEDQMAKKNQELKRLQEDLYVFKDALAAAGKKPPGSTFSGNPEAEAQWLTTLLLLQKQKKEEAEQQAKKLKQDTRVEELTKELTQLKSVLEKTQQESESFKQSLDMMQTEKSQLEKTVNSLQLEAQRLEQELLLTRTKEEDNQRKMDQMGHLHKEALVIPNQQVSNLTRDLTKMREQLTQATQQVDNLKRTNTEEKALLRRSLEQELESKMKYQEEIWHLETQRQVMQVTEVIQMKQQELVKTQQELSKIQQSLSKTHQELTKALDELSKSQQMLPKTQDQLSKTQDQLAQAQQELSKTQLELTRVRQELTRIEEEFFKSKQENTIIHQQLTNTQQEVDKMQRQFTITQQELTITLQELNRFQQENNVLLKRLEKLQNELDLCQTQKNTLTCGLMIANAAVEGKDLLLTQSEDKLTRLQEEKNRLCNQIVHLENQMQLLESKLTNMNQKEVEQKDWHEKLSTLQHDISFEQAKSIALKEEQTKAIAIAQEKVDHAEKCMKSMQEELQTANLCLVERKRQLELLTQEKNCLQEDYQQLTLELDKLKELSLQQQKQTTKEDEDQKMDLRNVMLQLKEDKQLIQQIVCTLAKRMKLQMDMVQVVPPELKNRNTTNTPHSTTTTTTTSKRPSTVGATRPTTTVAGSTGRSSMMSSVAGTLDDFVSRFQTEQPNEWRRMQENWAILQQEVDDADWKLVHLRNRLEEMVLEGSGSTTGSGALTLDLSSVSGNFTPGKNHHNFGGASPYSDAIKTGKSTLAIANESLKQSNSRQSLLLNPTATGTRPGTRVPDNSDEDDVDHTKEETESFIIALKKEMKTMRESYENKLEELNTEVKKIQKLRMDSTQRLRTELDEEKQKNRQLITQLNEQLNQLEQKILETQRKNQKLQDQEIEVLEKYTEAIDVKTRQLIMKELFELILNSCKDEMAIRTARRQERFQKLHAYCGSSSVAGAREEAKNLK